MRPMTYSGTKYRQTPTTAAPGQYESQKSAGRKVLKVHFWHSCVQSTINKYSLIRQSQYFSSPEHPLDIIL